MAARPEDFLVSGGRGDIIPRCFMVALAAETGVRSATNEWSPCTRGFLWQRRNVLDVGGIPAWWGPVTLTVQPLRDPLTHPVRKEIYEFVRDHPGIALGDLDAAIHHGWGTLLHHVQVLERARLMAEEEEAGRRRLFVPGTVPRDQRHRVAMLANPTIRAIHRLIQDNPGCHQSSLALAMDLSRTAIRKHCRRMEDAGLLRSERSGRRLRYHAVMLPGEVGRADAAPGEEGRTDASPAEAGRADAPSGNAGRADAFPGDVRRADASDAIGRKVAGSAESAASARPLQAGPPDATDHAEPTHRSAHNQDPDPPATSNRHAETRHLDDGSHRAAIDRGAGRPSSPPGAAAGADPDPIAGDDPAARDGDATEGTGSLADRDRTRRKSRQLWASD